MSHGWLPWRGTFPGNMPRASKISRSAFKALHHLLLSHGLAAEAIHASAKRPIKVGITLNLNPVHPASESKRDRDAALRMDAVLNRATFDPLLKRHFTDPGICRRKIALGVADQAR